MKWLLIMAICFTFSSHAQVIDVNGDNTVGPEEALAVAENWKGATATPNAHNHLGQEWKGSGRPLSIRGSFFTRDFIDVKDASDEKGFAIVNRRAAALILDNTRSTNGIDDPDLLLGGPVGKIAVDNTGVGDFVIVTNRFLSIDLNNDRAPGENADGVFRIRNSDGDYVFQVDEAGDGFILGGFSTTFSTTVMDHPLDPEGKFLVHSSVDSPDRKNVYDGLTTLDDNGEAIVELPTYFEALNADYRYQLTPIGGAAPNLHVAKRIEANQFKIAGGRPGLEVSWMVTGVRQDAYAKSNPLKVERDKPEMKKE